MPRSESAATTTSFGIQFVVAVVGVVDVVVEVVVGIFGRSTYHLHVCNTRLYDTLVSEYSTSQLKGTDNRVNY